MTSQTAIAIARIKFRQTDCWILIKDHSIGPTEVNIEKLT